MSMKIWIVFTHPQQYAAVNNWHTIKMTTLEINSLKKLVGTTHPPPPISRCVQTTCVLVNSAENSINLFSIRPDGSAENEQFVYYTMLYDA